jgi:hypothetical protein
MALLTLVPLARAVIFYIRLVLLQKPQVGASGAPIFSFQPEEYTRFMPMAHGNPST